MPINKISEETKNAILRKSAFSLPDNPSEIGVNAGDIKKAFYAPIIDDNQSAISEINRIVGEVNDILNKKQNTQENMGLSKNDFTDDCKSGALFAESERQKSKNLFKVNNNAGYSITRNGVTATINEDYTITLNGACTATTYFNIFNTISGGADFVNTYKKLYLDSNKTYTYLLKVISGSYSGINSQSQLTMTFRQTDGTGVVQGKSIDLSITDNNISNLAKSGIDYLNNGYFRTLSGITYTNYTFGLMICEGEDTDYQAYNGAIVHEKQIADVEHVEILYDMSTKNVINGTAYSSGLKADAGASQYQLGITKDKYKSVFVEASLDSMNTSTEIKVKGEDAQQGGLITTNIRDNSKGISTMSFRLYADGHLRVIFATYQTPTAEYDKNNNSTYIITRIKGVKA